MKKIIHILSVCKVDVFLIKYPCWVWFIASAVKIASVILFSNYLSERLFSHFVFHDIHKNDLLKHLLSRTVSFWGGNQNFFTY